MSRIVVLPKNVVEKIAAGEVVERPASVVKELIENSIDANAKKIRIEFWRGGKKEIIVKDDGIGMSREDAILAFKRHATSKIRSEEDLEKITTLGFRGEALPSIAAVAKVEMVTRSEEDIVGTRIVIEGGEVKKVESVSAPRGTTVKVKDLFYNTPARKKFLKSVAAETSQIIDIATKYALAYPEKHIVLINEGKEVFNAPPSDDLENIAYVLGIDIAKSMLRVERKEDYVKIEGYISKPDKTLGNRSGMHIFVNGRYVRDEFLYDSVISGYRNLLFRKRYPYCVLRVEVPPDKVDVNVHPAKITVKFEDEELLRKVITKAVWEALIPQRLIPKPDIPAKTRVEVKREVAAKKLPLEPKPALKEKTPERIEEFWGEYRLPPMEILGQVEDTYIVAKYSGGIALIDQHAAHERIRYEKLLRSMDEKKYQNLIAPRVLSLSKREIEEIYQYREDLEKVGFEFEEFGENTIAVRKIPVVLTRDVEEFLRELLSELRRKRFVKKSEVLDEIVKNVACRGAIKANEPLTDEKMRAILSDLRKCENPFTCPHGRPTVIFLNRESIEKMFKRSV